MVVNGDDDDDNDDDDTASDGTFARSRRDATRSFNKNHWLNE